MRKFFPSPQGCRKTQVYSGRRLTCSALSPHFSPSAVMIAPDFLRQRVPATMSVSGIRLRKHVPVGLAHKSVWNGFGHSKSA